MKRVPLYIFVLFLIVIIGVVFSYKKSQIPQEKPENIEQKYFLFYTNSQGVVEEYRLPARATGSTDGNVYLGAKDGIFGVKVDPISGNIVELRDTIDVAEKLEDISTPDDWDILDSASPMIHRMYQLFRSHETNNWNPNDGDRNTLPELFFPTSLSSVPPASVFAECIKNPYAVIDTTLLNPTGKDICKEPVPQDLVFTQHEEDVRYKRFRYAVFYDAYTSRDIKSCDPLLRTSFLYDNEHDPIVSQSQNYLLCESLIARDSKAIRDMSFRFGHITYEGRCELYINPEIQNRCKKIVSLNAHNKANEQN